jgi:hypothetical protein
MFRALNRMGDRLLDRLLPSTTARAEACWWDSVLRMTCCLYAGVKYCHL